VDLPTYLFEPSLAGLLSLVVTVILPLLVGLVTTRVTGAGVKAVILLVLATVKTVVEAWIAAGAGVDWDFVPVLYNAVVNFGIAVAIHFGLWKPTGASTAAQNTGRTA